MSLLKTKYYQNNSAENVRETRIQKVQQLQNCSRDYAVRFIDYQNQMIGHIGMNQVAGLTFFGMTRFWLSSYTSHYGYINKPYTLIPVLSFSYFLGHVLYDKLTGHYLNMTYDNREASHHWLVDYANEFDVITDKTKIEENWSESINLTPFERLSRNIYNKLNEIDLEGSKVFKREFKDKNDFYYLFGKVRNLENIIYLKPEELENVSNPVELQMKLDSVKADLTPSINQGNIDNEYNNKINEVQDLLHNYKSLVENSNNFRSIKDKLLGLPFMMLRHRQFPEPVSGTWQYDLFKELFNEDYDHLKGIPDVEEKVNKYNYNEFLHPSIIAKYDTNSDAFDMFLRTLNIEMKTQHQERVKRREYYCKQILPLLNKIDNKEDGYNLANYILNKFKLNQSEIYYYNQYSGAKEEELFREAEEKKYLDKNKPFVFRTQYSNVLKDKIGIKSSELDEILKNPTKYKRVRKALENSFPHYEATSYIDKLRNAKNRSGLIDTMIREKVDLTDPEVDLAHLLDLQYESRDPGEEEQAIMSYHLNEPYGPHDNNSYPYGQTHENEFYYCSQLDWNDYKSDFPDYGIISPKNFRFDLFKSDVQEQCNYFNN